MRPPTPLLRLLRPSASLRHVRPYSSGPPSTPPRGAMGPPQTMQPSNPAAVLNDLNILSSFPPPLANVDGVLPTGFVFGGSTNIVGEQMGVVIIGGEVFRWYPFGIEGGEGVKAAEGQRAEVPSGGRSRAVGSGRRGEVEKGDKERWGAAEEEARKKSILRMEDRAIWGILDVIWPKPDILVVGTGARNLLISPTTRKLLNDYGVRLEISDTWNAASNYNLLATERPGQVAAALLPVCFGEKPKKK